jgi:hypothetical protein
MSMAPSTVRMVLVEGENADGATVDEDGFEVHSTEDADTLTTPSGADRVLAAIMGTRESASEGGYRLTSTGVAWTDPIEAGALRDALAARKVENVMLVSAFLAAAALAQTVGTAQGYSHTGLLFIEPDCATLAVVDSADGSIAEVRREVLPDDDTEAVAQLTAMAAGADELESRPQGLFVVGSGVDVGMIKPELEAATALAVSVPGEPETALARGAALASAHSPLFESTTAALAYAQDPGTGAVDPEVALAAGLAVADGAVAGDAAGEALAYSAAPDEEADAYTAVAAGDLSAPGAAVLDGAEETESDRKPFLVALGVLMVFVVGVATLAIALALHIRPQVDNRPNLGQPRVVVPAKPAPPPPPQAPAPAPAPAAPAPAPAPAPAAPAPAPALPPPPALPAPPPALPAPPPMLPGPGIPGPMIPGPKIPGPGIPGIGGGHGGFPGIPHF